jgi:transcriptional regulator with XRE-family HTH domain
MTSTSDGREGRTAIKRPGSGIAIDRDALVRLRQYRLLTRAQLARAMTGDGYKITPDAIAKIENGWRKPKITTLARLCQALDCTPVELLPPEASVPAELLPPQEGDGSERAGEASGHEVHEEAG